MNQDVATKSIVLVMAFGITLLFLAMIQKFLMALFLAAIFSALARPLFLRLETRFGGRRHLASAATLAVMVILVLLPLTLLIGVVIAQAIEISAVVTPWVKAQLASPDSFSEGLRRLPFYEELLPLRNLLLEQVGEAVSITSKFIVGGLSSLTIGTLNFFLMSFVILYSMYFLQMDGDRVVERILYYLPLKAADERIMLQKFTSVTRATIKGTLVIGLLQGGLAGIAFAVAGIDNWVFWGTLMVVLSIIPAVGAALVWIPACIVLAFQGQVMTALLLGLFCALVVGSLDNILRPILVGRDTQMHELMIFLSTLGGLVMFGFTGIFIGPLIASFFISIWEMYGVEFADVLPDTEDVLAVLSHLDDPPESERTGGDGERSPPSERER
ncbi:AI-2E family transporter [Thiocapsa imhoffii]|uniref:AI-2E family transporter n=1 Tax=Thiocapsa imhoffii TaxID=382777 RepID=A0A9X0WKA1_9GAMM|nr:AI-2E family transporter [Thiocapsa imhoffii]MBK1645712.1 AI-2E family transporter [Thiocapsa imhoffii]